MKKCRKCGHFKPITGFFLNGYRRKDGTSKHRNECKACNVAAHDKYAKKNRKHLNAYMKSRYTEEEKVRIRVYGLKRNYGLSEVDFDKLMVAQKGECAVCNKKDTKRPLQVDHCHSSGKVRGLCCLKCNRGMGLMEDNPEYLRNAADFIERIRSKG